MKKTFWLALAALALLALLVAVVSLRPASSPPAARPGSPSPTYPCPQATPELLAVEPLTSPTQALSQLVTVRMGNLEAVTISLESGVFTAAGGLVAVDLLPDAVHHLEVVARVRRIVDGQGCAYGGYTLAATRDRTGAPLIIVQGRPAAPASPQAVIDPHNAAGLVEIAALSPPARLVTDFAFLGDAELLTAGYDDPVRRWSLASGREIGPIGDRPPGQDGPPPSEALLVAAGPGGAVIATAGVAASPVIRLWDVAAGGVRELGRCGGTPQSLAFSPSGGLLAAGGSDDTVQVWAVDGGRLVAEFHGDTAGRLQSFHTLAWIGDGRLVAGASDAIFWYDVEAGRAVRSAPKPGGAGIVVGIAVARGGERIAAVAQDDRLYLWDEKGGWAAWPAGAGAVLAHVAFSPGESLVAAASYDGDWYVWDAAGGDLLLSRPAAGPAGASGVQFSPDGRFLAVGGWQAPVRLWAIP